MRLWGFVDLAWGGTVNDLKLYGHGEVKDDTKTTMFLNSVGSSELQQRHMIFR